MAAILKRMMKHSLAAAPALDRAFHALADPHRRAMVARLARGPATVTALATPLPISLPAVVQHLKVLEEGGLVTSQKVGRVRTCAIATGALKAAEGWLAAQYDMWSARFDRFDAHVAQMPDDPAVEE